MQRAFGTKKKTLANTQSPMEEGPDAAANAIQRGERIAATFMSTRSRVPSCRRSPSIAAHNRVAGTGFNLHPPQSKSAG